MLLLCFLMLPKRHVDRLRPISRLASCTLWRKSSVSTPKRLSVTSELTRFRLSELLRRKRLRHLRRLSLRATCQMYFSPGQASLLKAISATGSALTTGCTLSAPWQSAKEVSTARPASARLTRMPPVSPLTAISKPGQLPASLTTATRRITSLPSHTPM